MPDSTGPADPSSASPGAGHAGPPPLTTVVHGALHRVAAAFAYPDFRKLWFGACTSSIGTWMQSVAQNWLVLTITGSAFYLGLDAFLGQLPIMLFMLVGGVMADRHDRRRILLTSQYIQMTSAFTLTLLVFLHVVHPGGTAAGSISLTVWYVLGLSFVNGCAQAFGGPAHQTLVPALVGKRDLPNAVALNSIQFNIARIVGPLLAGVALATLGTVFCFAMNGLSFVAVIVSLLLLHIPPREPLAPQPLVEQLRSGVSYVRREGPLLGLIAVAFVTAFLGTPLLTLLPVFVQKVFHHGVGEYSRMMAFQGVGAVLGALAVAWLGRFRRMGTTALLIQVVFGAIIACFALCRAPALSYALLLLAGVAQLLVSSLVTSLVQLIAPDEMRGRVMSIYLLAFRSGMPLGSLAAGALAHVTSVPFVLVVNGALLSLLGAGALAGSRRLRGI